MTQAVNKPEWSGLTLVVGDNTHVLPLHEDDRIHEVRAGADCPCKPELVGQTFGERRHEPPRNIYHHKFLRPQTKQ